MYDLRVCGSSRGVKRRFISKMKGCSTCSGPCVTPPATDVNLHVDQQVEDEVEELNAPLGNWRHRKAHNAAVKDAALRQRVIPTPENAHTEAQKKMAAMAAKFRKPNQ